MEKTFYKSFEASRNRSVGVAFVFISCNRCDCQQGTGCMVILPRPYLSPVALEQRSRLVGAGGENASLITPWHVALRSILIGIEIIMEIKWIDGQASYLSRMENKTRDRTFAKTDGGTVHMSCWTSTYYYYPNTTDITQPCILKQIKRYLLCRS